MLIQTREAGGRGGGGGGGGGEGRSVECLERKMERGKRSEERGVRRGDGRGRGLDDPPASPLTASSSSAMRSRTGTGASSGAGVGSGLREVGAEGPRGTSSSPPGAAPSGMASVDMASELAAVLRFGQGGRAPLSARCSAFAGPSGGGPRVRMQCPQSRDGATPVRFWPAFIIRDWFRVTTCVWGVV